MGINFHLYVQFSYQPDFLQMLSFLGVDSVSQHSKHFTLTAEHKTGQTHSGSGQERILLKRILFQKPHLLCLPGSKRSKDFLRSISSFDSLAVRKSILTITQKNKRCLFFQLLEIYNFFCFPIIFTVLLNWAATVHLRINHVCIHCSGRMQTNQCKLIISVGNTIKSKG